MTLPNPQEDANWKFGVIYFNRADPRLFVPKRLGVGSTLNLARPAAWLVIAGLVAAAFLFRALRSM